MFPAIDSSEDKSIFVQRMAIQLATISKLEDALPNLNGGTVNLIKE
jgi:hypothetical protein